jgi:hypothetical protein
VISTHVYEAEVIGTPDLPLDVLGGTIALDETAAPHVQGNLTLAIPSLSTLNAMDPRNTPRVRVSVTATYPTGAPVSRVFNLGVRDRRVDVESGTLSVSVASDEALLIDYAPLTDDYTAFTHQASLRAVVNYALAVAIPGESLEATPAANANATTYASAVNECPNPSAGVDTAGWTAQSVTLTRLTGVGAIFQNSLGTCFRLQGLSTSGVTYIWRALDVSRVAGREWMFRARQRNGSAIASGTPDPGSRISIQYTAPSTGTVSAQSPIGSTANNTTTDHYVRVRFPPDITAASIRLYHGVRSTDSVYWADIRYGEFTLDPTDTGYFAGDTTDTASYLYDWTGTAHASTSTRTALVDRPTDALLWRAGQSALDFLSPLVQVYGLRLVCDESRAWTLRPEGYTAPGPSLAVQYGTNLLGADDTISRDSQLWFDAAVTVYRWTDTTGATRERTDSYALNTPHTLLRRFEKDSAYPGPGFSEYAVRRAQGLGHDLMVRLVADWRFRAEQTAMVVLPDTTTQAGEISRLVYDLDRDEMSVTTRTTDTPVGAINLLPGTINALPGTINAL